MSRRILAAAAACLWATPALAATYSVSPTGSGTTCSPGSPCALATANANAQPGDIISMANGTYSTAPIPARSGTPTARIEYRGNPANKNAVVVPATLVRELDYVTYRYFRVNGGSGAGFRLDGDLDGWRIGGLTVIGDVLLGGLEHSTIDSLAQYPPSNSGGLDYNFFMLGAQVCPLSGYADSTYDNVIAACSLYVRTNGATYCGTDPIFKMWSMNGDNIRRLTFKNNKILVVFGMGSDDNKRGIYLGDIEQCDFRNNRWTIVDSAGCSDQRLALRIRDYFRYNRFDSDSFFVNNVCAPFYLSSQGSPNDRTSEGGSRWNNCYFRLSNSQPLSFEWGMRSDTLSGCVILSTGRCLSIPGLTGGENVLDHNTFVMTGPSGAPVELPTASGTYGSWVSTAALRVTNNIFAVRSTGSSTMGVDYQLWSGRPITINNNLYANFNGAGSRSISYQYNCTGPNSAGCTPSPAGLSRPGTGQPFYNGTGQDGASVYGSAQFMDSTFATFDPRLRSGSAAIGIGTLGTDAGAIPFAVAGPDIVPPAAILSLAASMKSDVNLTLGWTATGDDGLSGVATAYDLRRSMTPITDLNFGSATSVVVGAPGPSGSSQATVVTGLSPGTAYYFALKARDEAGNWSLLGNVLAVTMDTSDRVPPGSVPDLSNGP